MANIHDITRNAFMLRGPLAKKGYDWWWHSLTAEHAVTGEKKPFYVEFFTCNPALAQEEPVIVWNDPEKQKAGILPSYLMVNVGFWGKDHGQLHAFYPWKDVTIHADAPYSVACDGCTCSETHTEGSVTVTPEQAKEHPEWMCDAGSLSWKLDIDKKIAFHVGFWGKDHGQLHAFYPWKDVTIHADAPYSIACDGCTCSETHTEGSVTVTPEQAQAHPEWMCDAGSLSWKLDIDKKIAFHVGYGASKFFRDINAFEMFWHAEGMKTLYSGEIVLNGEKYIVRPETCNGYADKNWGGDFTSPWVWLSSNELRSRITGRKLENSVFNIGGGRPKVGPIALNRKLLGEFYYEGKDYEFNFSKFWTLSGTKFDCWETEDEIHWHVVQTTATAKLDTQIVCKKADMLNINYEAPTGLKRHNRLWNGGNGTGVLKLYKRNLFGKETLIDEVEATGIGCEFGEYDR